MSRYKMHAIEYNTLMTLLKLLTDDMPNILGEYNIGKVNVIPAYPRDITKMTKPSIIVRRVDTERSKVGMGNVIGQLFEDDTYSDMYGIRHDIMVQFDVIANNNTQTTLLTSILCDMLSDIVIGGGKIQLYDFTLDINNPSKMGVMKMLDAPSTTYIPDNLSRPNMNSDYISASRTDFTIIQEIKPKQDYVNLGKWLKINQVIKANYKEVIQNG